MFFKTKKMALEISGVEKKGSSWRQILQAFLASLPFFTLSLETTSLNNFKILPAPPTDVPWSITIRVLVAIVTAPGYCYLMRRWGRRTALCLIVFLQALSCIPLFLSPTIITSTALHLITGAYYSGIYITIPIYIRETNDNHRSPMLALIMVMTNLGQVVRMLVTFEVMMIIKVIMVVVQFLSLVMIVESSSYYVVIGEDQKALTAHAKLKCLNEDESSVTSEIEALRNERKRARDKMMENTGYFTLVRIWKNLIWRDITVIGVILHTVTTLCGSIVFLDHRKILMQLKLDNEPDEVLVYTCLLVGALICLVTIQFVERRVLLTLGFCIMVLSMGVLAIYTQVDLTIRYLREVPFVCLVLTLICYGLIRDLPLIVMTEMLNLEIRSTIIGFLFIYTQLLTIIQEHSFKYIEDYVGLYTTLYIYVGINIYGFVYSLFRLPDIKNKNARQIERQVKRIPLFDF